MLLNPLPFKVSQSEKVIRAAGIAARHPDRFAGALLMAPVRNGDLTTNASIQAPAQGQQGYACVCDTSEHPAMWQGRRNTSKVQGVATFSTNSTLA